MPDRRAHRGRHPDDLKLFSEAAIPTLRVAVDEYSWLLTRSYGEPSALKLVGDRYQLTTRQREAVKRAACSDDSRVTRKKKHCKLPLEPNSKLLIDGYNLLITVESALSDSFVFVGRDGCYRDLASLHGTYREVEETVPALQVIGEFLAKHHTGGEVTWYLDAPVSNSGRLAERIRTVAATHGWVWYAQVVPDADRVLSVGNHAVVITSDSMILERCSRWIDVAKGVVDGLRQSQKIRLVDLRCEAP